MNTMNIQDVDLNLLVAFNAMIEERNVTRAGVRVGLTQSSMSHALTRLRAIWGDPLFVRAGSSMEPTLFAQRIAPSIAQGLASLQESISSSINFDPMTSERTFHLLISDIGEAAYLPRLLARFGDVAPKVNLRALTLPRDSYRAALESGEADLAMGFLPGLQAGFYQQSLIEDSYVCLVRDNHPRIGRTIDLEQFCAESHVLVEPGGTRFNEIASQSSTSSLLEKFISEKGIKRRIAVRVPHFIVVPKIVQATNLLAVIPHYVISAVGLTEGLRMLELPFEAPNFNSMQVWHARNHHEEGNRWLRSVVAELFLEEKKQRNAHRKADSPEPTLGRLKR